MTRSLVPAAGDILEEILDETYPIWNEGLTRENYGRFNLAQMKTPWGGAHIERVALLDNGRLLATAKRYDLRARLDNAPVRVLGVGAVFTPQRLRGRGLGSELISRILTEASAAGYDLALLFSAIGASYYQRLGFDQVPVEQVLIEVRPKAGAPAMLMRSGDDRDIRFLAEMHEARAAALSPRFVLERDADFIRFSIARKRILSGFGPPGLRQLEFFVVDEGERAASYVVLLNSNGSRMLSECGDRDPSGARLGALLQTILARTPREKPAPIRAWLPPGFRPPQLALIREQRPVVTMMLKPIRQGLSIDPPLAPNDVMYFLGDVV